MKERFFGVTVCLFLLMAVVCASAFAAKKDFLIPKDTWDFSDVKFWFDEWHGTIKVKQEDPRGRAIPVWLAWLPYLLVALFLVISRLPQLNVGFWLKSVNISWESIFGTGINAATTPLYLPGTILLLVVALIYSNIPFRKKKT